ncbi:alkane hydroxylase MAH1 [Trifolium repens]|nr:alkane hydroxylase MAH1 [Trifolium repens]
MKKFETSAQQNIRKKLENCLLPFVDHHASTKGVQVFDLQDILERFTFDITCTFLFGFDPNSLPFKFNELPDIALPADIACTNAISLLEDMTTSRHYIPKCIWKLQIKNG